MDRAEAEKLALRIVADAAGAFAVAQGFLGDRLGLFRVLAERGPLDAEGLAAAARIHPRYAREWARAMVAAGYIEHDPATDRFFLTEEQAAVLADEDGPFFGAGVLHAALPMLLTVPRLLDAFRTGEGVAWNELGGRLAAELVVATERSLRPDYEHRLVEHWLPAVPGLVPRLAAGARVADLGCGVGVSTRVMARAFPRSTFVGYDTDEVALARARRCAEEEGLANVHFLAEDAERLAANGPYELVTCFDSVHDMSAPEGVLRAVREALAPEGVCLWQEPRGEAAPAANRGPIGRFFANLSPLVCLPAARAGGGEGLGTIVPPETARALAEAAGFRSCVELDLPHPFRRFYLLSP